MSYITTYTGKHFDPINPDASLLCIEDIAHAFVAFVPRKWARTDLFLSWTALHCLRERSAGSRAIGTSGSCVSDS